MFGPGEKIRLSVFPWGRVFDVFFPDAPLFLSCVLPYSAQSEDQPLTERTVVSQWLGAELWQDENQFYSVGSLSHAQLHSAELWSCGAVEKAAVSRGCCIHRLVYW